MIKSAITEYALSSEIPKMYNHEGLAIPIIDLSVFYPIARDEIGHQDYYKKNPLRYKLYRQSCGRDTRIAEIWGSEPPVPSVETQ